MPTSEDNRQHCTRCDRRTEWSLKQETGGRIHRCNVCGGTQYRSGGITISDVRQPAGRR